MDEQNQPTIPPKATPLAAPGAPRPITVRLKPIAPPAAGAGAPISPAAPASAAGTTLRLRPVSLAPSMTAQIVPGAGPSTPAQIAATVQAAKSKTSRIALDSVMGVATSIPIAPADNSGPKTIRLKRPTDLASPSTTSPSPIIPQNLKSATAAIIPPPVMRPASTTSPIKPGVPRQTSRIPDSVIPTDAPASQAVSPANVDSSVITQKKTLKIRRSGAPDAATASAESSDNADGVTMMPISDIEGMPVSKGYKALTVIAIFSASVAAMLLIGLNWCLAADAVAPLADKHSAASVPVDADLPWPGKFLQK